MNSSSLASSIAGVAAMIRLLHIGCRTHAAARPSTLRHRGVKDVFVAAARCGGGGGHVAGLT
jgi:hypothetical protein